MLQAHCLLSRLLFQCRYSGTSVEALVVEVNTVPPPPPVAAPGPLRVELRLANGQCVTKGCAEGDEAYTSYYSDADYPVTKVLREPVYVEVHILERTDPNIVLMLGRCWATSTPSPLSLPQWDLLVDGCPYQDDRYLTTLVPVAGSSGLQFPTHYKRFVVKMFTFVDPASLAPLQETIFIHCSTAVCHPSSGSCEQSCTRKRRDTHVKTISSGQTVVSSGQVNLVNKLTSGFKSQFNSNLVNGFLSRSKSQFNSNLVNGFLSRFKSQFKSKLVNGFLSRFKSQFKSKLVNRFLRRFNSKLVNGFLSRFKSRFKSKLVSSFLSRFNSKLVNGFLSRFKSQFNSKLVNSFLSRFNSKLVNGFLRQFNSKLVNSFLSQFNSKLVNSFLSQFNSKLVNSFLSSFSLSSQWHRQIPLTNEDSGYVVYENRMTSSYEVGIGPLGSITRDSHFELLFQCRYSGTSVEALVVEVNTVPPPPPVAAPGPLRVELRLANGQCVTKGCAEGDEAYTSYYSDADYPVTKVLREPVYVEVHILERTDPNIVLMLGRCWATSTPSPLSLPQWDLLVDGCPYQDDRYLTTLVPVAGSSGLQFPTHYKRFVVKMFTFVDPASLAPLQETIFIHCSTAVCHPSSGSCEQSCTRKRRDTHVKTISSGQTVVSSGQVNLVKAVRSLYDRSRSLVRIAGSKSDFFPVHVGLRQGCPLSPVLFIIFMDRISRRSQRPEGVRFGDNTISSLLFADDVVVLAPSDQDLQHALGRFAAECEAAGMRISTSKSEAMVLSRKKVACLLQVGGEFLPQVEEFKYLGVLFTSEGRMEREIDRRIGAASAVMRSMYRSVVVKKELSRKAKLSIYRSIYVPTLTYGHELWVMTERTRSRIQAAEMSFLRRVAGRSLRDRVRSSVTREELRVEPLLLHIERGQLRWLGHLFRMPPGRLPGKAFRARPTGRRPRGRPRTRWRDYVSRLAWERLGVPPEELEEVSREREVWASLLRLLPRDPALDKRKMAWYGTLRSLEDKNVPVKHCHNVRLWSTDLSLVSF
ncbi:unnamed protein product [Leuciscus chuanchicus]